MNTLSGFSVLRIGPSVGRAPGNIIMASVLSAHEFAKVKLFFFLWYKDAYNPRQCGYVNCHFINLH
jgi:hypothetical protein